MANDYLFSQDIAEHAPPELNLVSFTTERLGSQGPGQNSQTRGDLN